MGIAFGAPVRTLDTVLCDTPAASAMSCIVGRWPGIRAGATPFDFAIVPASPLPSAAAVRVGRPEPPPRLVAGVCLALPAISCPRFARCEFDRRHRMRWQ